MKTSVGADLLRSMQTQSSDKLDKLRDAARRMRDLEKEIADLDEERELKTKQLKDIQHKTLPELFDAAGVKSIALEAEGNMPAVSFTMEPYYAANIAAGWPEEKRAAAFAHLEKTGHGDIIKTKFEVQLGLKSDAEAKRVRAALRKLGVDYVEKRDVPWASLTALVREQAEEGKLKLDLSLIGGTIGSVVKPKRVKTK